MALHGMLRRLLPRPGRISWCMKRAMSQTGQRERCFQYPKKKKQGALSSDASWEERLSDVVTPLWRLGYEEQLQYKMGAMQDVLRELTQRLKEHGGKNCDHNDLVCPLHEILPSPEIYGYRNKTSFSVNCGPDGDPKTVGHFVGKSRERNIVCVRTDHLINIPEKHKLAAKCYEDFLHLSPLQPCIRYHDGGHWREIIVRTNSHGETMAIVIFHPQDFGQDEVCFHMQSLKEYFTKGAGSICNLSSLYYQLNDTKTHQPTSPVLLYGIPHLIEQILDLRLRVSPTTFLQVNTPAAERLYRTLGNMNQDHVSRTLFDVCCGTGVIGLSLADRYQEVIGVELANEAVSDADWNAAYNEIKNCQFIAGRAEKLLPQLLETRPESEPVVAVVNPPRAGLHPRVVRALRRCESLRTLLFVTCKLNGEAGRNLIELCCPSSPEKRLLGESFVPQEAVAVDMFPHTAHCELVLRLTR
ncbi:tRNA (uracil-5-)-methyltransferase homolog B isoform X2 [Bombina bombina]|nr:tRNA (uracil-5-)-methyltransferase homolog B isoform X2 [Bombina bombina]XP_053554938.1 tRNA (uracil-5-)-methyltransferase homolog B isoform X2 [Bombina bombina]